MMAVLRDALQDLANGVRGLVSRCVIAAPTTGRRMQFAAVQLGPGEAKAQVEVFTGYGFAAAAPPGTEGIALSVGGDRGHVVVVATSNRRYCLPLAEAGDVAVYTLQDGQPGGHHILLKAGGQAIEIHAKDIALRASERLTLDCGGNGIDFTPTTRIDYVAGAAVTTTALHPPTIRPEP